MSIRKRGVWTIIEERIGRQKAKMTVLRKMLETGIRVGEDGRYYISDIEVPDASISKSLKVDRRVIRQAADVILDEPELESIFTKLMPIAFLRDVASYLGFGVIIITSSPEKAGIISEVTTIAAKHKLIIRQIYAEDPELFQEPKLTLIIEGDVPSEAIAELQSSKKVKTLTIIK